MGKSTPNITSYQALKNHIRLLKKRFDAGFKLFIHFFSFPFYGTSLHLYTISTTQFPFRLVIIMYLQRNPIKMNASMEMKENLIVISNPFVWE